MFIKATIRFSNNIILLCLFLQLFIPQVKSEFSMDDCGESKGCLFKPDNCVPYENCAYIFTYSADSHMVYIELFGQVLDSQDTFLAVGFSQDNEMGNDTVTDCSSFNGTPFAGRLSYNPGKSNIRVPLNQSTQDSILKTISVEYNNGTLYCQFAQNIIPPANVLPMFVAPLDRFYYILMASGRTTSLYSHPELSVHTLNESSVLFPYISPFPVDLQRFKRAENSLTTNSNYQSNSFSQGNSNNSNAQNNNSLQYQTTNPLLDGDTTANQNFNSNMSSLGVQRQRQYPTQQVPNKQNQFPIQTSNNGQVQQDPPPSSQVQQMDPPRDPITENKLRTAHGICMTLALIFFLSNGILWASQYRLVWPGVQPFGLQIWFHIHRTLNVLAAALMVCGFVMIFVAADWRWVGPRAYATVEENQQWVSIHAILGILTCCVVWAQPLLAVWRCHPHTPFRIIFRLLHGFLGYGAWLMGAAAIMIATVHFENMFINQRAAMGLFIAFVAVSGIVIIVLTLMSIVRWFRIRRSTVSHEIEMKEINGKVETTIIPPEDRNLRIIILVFYVIVSVGIAVAISALIGVRNTAINQAR